MKIGAVLAEIFALFDAAVAASPAVPGAGAPMPTRFHTLLADGTDSVAADLALARGYELVAPLPFGRRLNKAINALPPDAADARALLAGGPASDPATERRAGDIRRLTDRATVLGLADEDEAIAALYLAKLDAPTDFARAQLFAAESSRRVALAGRILIEQSDALIAVWDGVTTAHVGGTGDTIAAALHQGCPVLWIDPVRPAEWCILRTPESLAALDHAGGEDRLQLVEAIVRAALHPGDEPDHPGIGMLQHERWHPHSSGLAQGYRRIEALFGEDRWRGRLRDIRVTYRDPATMGEGAGEGPEMLATARALPCVDPALVARIEAGVLRRFAWMDGISAHLSDSYRGGMIVNFVLSSLAIVGGMSYLPFVSAPNKWLFALFELLLLSAILVITMLGQKRRWHGRWFETRRVAEYLRHGPILLTLGAARPPGRWPQGAETSWPEFYARNVMREIGLPAMVITAPYLRGVLTGLLDAHVVSQRDYHYGKAERLTTVHHRLDALSNRLFQLAVLSVALYLALRGMAAGGLISEEWLDHQSKWFTVLGVMFPTFGAGIAGIRYFGDFERFAAISEVTAEKLDSVHERITVLAAAPDAALNYGRVAELAHATDEIVFDEIENWQAVFGGKQIAVPV
ncbi:MAG TPA: hypothetical protein VHG29_01545 [Novosphingobium sp.]|nr:hypothetical protein [Novosphingobium sp.]